MQGDRDSLWPQVCVDEESKHVRYTALATLALLLFVVVARDDLGNALEKRAQALKELDHVETLLAKNQAKYNDLSGTLEQLNEQSHATQLELSKVQGDLDVFDLEAERSTKNVQRGLAQLEEEKQNREARLRSAQAALHWGKGYLRNLESLRQNHLEGAEQWCIEQRRNNELEERKILQHTAAVDEVDKRIEERRKLGNGLEESQKGQRQQLEARRKTKADEVDATQQHAQKLKEEMKNTATERAQIDKQSKDWKKQQEETQKELDAVRTTIERLPIRSLYIFRLGPLGLSLLYCYFAIHLAALRKKVRSVRTLVGEDAIHASLASLTVSEEPSMRLVAGIALLVYELLVTVVAQGWLMYRLCETPYKMVDWPLHGLGLSLALVAFILSLRVAMRYRHA